MSETTEIEQPRNNQGARPSRDLLFAPPTGSWIPLSERYLLLKRVAAALCWSLPFLAAALAVWLVLHLVWPCLALIAFGLALGALRCWRMSALWRSWGYAELADDLYVTHGLLFRRLTVVPYGRMQVVEVQSDPIERLFGLATVKLVTASASTDATIPGLLPEQAASLRDRLAERGESRTSGL